MISKHGRSIILIVLLINYLVVDSWLPQHQLRLSSRIHGSESRRCQNTFLSMSFNNRWKSNKKSLQTPRKDASTRQMERTAKKIAELRKIEKENRVQRLDIERVELSNITVGQKMRGRIISFSE
jgi:hypothetical protein